MQLVESYLNEIRRLLPADGRDDIVEELQATIAEQVADQAAEMGQPVGVEHEKVVLRKLGHPLKVAAAYQEERYLIGPSLFPTYAQTLKWVPVLVLAIQAVIALLGAAVNSDWTLSIGQLISGAISMLFWVVGIVTLSFVAIEYSGKRLNWYESWSPEQLSLGSATVIDRTGVLSNLITEGVFLLWWNNVLVFSNVLGGDYSFTLAAVWDSVFWPLNVLVAAFFCLHTYVLVRGIWHRVTLILEVVLGVLLLAVAAYLVSANPLVFVATDQFALPEAAQRTVQMVIIVVAGFQVWDIVVALRALKQSRL